MVKGASNGEGLGNKFLSNLGDVDAIIHVVRCFENKEITHVDDNLSPLKDIEVIETECLLSDLTKIENIIENLKKHKKIADEEIQLLEEAQRHLDKGRFLNLLKNHKTILKYLIIIIS